MGLKDRDWSMEAQKAPARKEGRTADSRPDARSPSNGLSRGLKWGPAGILVFWLAVMGLLYVAMNHYLKPKPVIVSASGDLVIPRSRDGHFYALGSVNGRPVNFLVDTGASLVTVSEQFARGAGLGDGEPTVFRTANGDLHGRIISDVPVSVGPLDISAVRIGVGLVGHPMGDALLGQSFLSKFETTLKAEQMILRKR